MFLLPSPALRACALLAAALAIAPAPARASEPAPAGHSVEIEELTHVELRERIAQGATTALVPIGGTEQNGPQMVLGKHNRRVRVLSRAIAEALGDAVVAPVLAYVPEGRATPPEAHMRFAGTLTIPEAVFEAVLEGTARSLRQHGIREVFFLGDHGGYQASERRVADKLNREWSKDAGGCRVHALDAYYQVTQNEYVAALKAKGFTDAEIGSHAGLADTSLALAIDLSLVRPQALAGAGLDAAHGVHGDPRRASAALGQVGTHLVIERSVAAIRRARQGRQ